MHVSGRFIIYGVIKQNGYFLLPYLGFINMQKIVKWQAKNLRYRYAPFLGTLFSTPLRGINFDSEEHPARGYK
jgi:hypothetical protein